jgi:hypothetical protein
VWFDCVTNCREQKQGSNEKRFSYSGFQSDDNITQGLLTAGNRRGAKRLEASLVRRAGLAMRKLEWFGFFQNMARDDQPLHF